jgi:hypothetical protein
MADCGDLETRLRELEEQKQLNDAVKRRIDGELNQLQADGPTKRIRRLRMVSGDYLEIDPQKFWNQVEKDALAIGEGEVAAAVRAGIDSRARPQGSKGLNINYAQLPPTAENIGRLLEVLGLEFNKSDGAAKLRRPFTEAAAQASFQLMAQAYGADPRALADAMKRKLAGIDQLPVNAYIVNRVKRDAVRYYADVLEETADIIPTGEVDQIVAQQVANAAQWAHYWQQFDIQVSRKIAQALRTRQFGDWVNEKIFMQFEKNVDLLKLDDIKGGSLAQQVLDHINNKDPLKLKRLATAARLDDLANRPMNEPNFMTQIEILNTYRKDNLFSSAATWLIRNPSSILVSGAYGLEDMVEGALKYGVKAELSATGHAFRSIYQGMNTTWRNAWDSFAYGRRSFAFEDVAELSPDVVMETKRRVTEDLNQSWELFTTPSYHLKTPLAGTAVTFLNLLNLSFRRFMLGPALEAGAEMLGKAMGRDLGDVSAGYTPAFRLLNAGDEVIRKISFDWKVNHEAWLRASKEAEGVVDENGRAAGANWIRQRAEELSEKAVFTGLMTDDELAKLRLREIGVTAGDMDNEALRLELFNNLQGIPNAADELGKLGMERGDNVTFTQKLDDRFTQGVQMLRGNPLAAWIIPVWRTPANGLKWLINHDMYVALPKQLYLETKNMAGEGGSGFRFWNEGAVDADLLAKSRAATAVSVFLAMSTQALWQAGIFSDGGPTNSQDRERWGRNNSPYSFSLTIGGFEAAKMSLKSIDLFDLMGLQADLQRAHHEGRLDNNSFTTMMGGIVTAYGRVFMNKSSLEGVTSLLNAVFRAGQGNDVDWFNELGKQTNGILPLSGMFSQISRGFSDPNQVPSQRRQLSAAEYAALQRDPNWETFSTIASKIFANYPVLGSIFPQEKENRDWIGTGMRRPLGLPIDHVTPYMAVIKPQEPLYDWLEKHGLGMKPRPDARVSTSDGIRVPTTMTKEQENTYRMAMMNATGSLPAAAVLGAGNSVVNVGTAVFSVDNYVQGRTLKQALEALSQDPDYNLELESPDGPSLVQQPNKSLSDRTGRVNDPRGVYKVFDAVVSYYDALGLQSMVQQHPEFRAMEEANVEELRGRVRERLEMSPMGILRQ